MNTVFFDVDTQWDFVLPAGALYVPGAERLIPAFTHLAQLAATHKCPLISTFDAHIENDPEFGSWKPHCVIGTVGQQKVAGTLLAQSLTIPTTPMDAETLAPNAALSPQFLVEKHNIEPFSNPNLTLLLELLKAERCIVYGVVTEVCVQRAAMGLLELGKEVHIVTDAIRSLAPGEADGYLESLRVRGAKLITVADATQ